MERKGIERSAALFRWRGLGLFWTFTSGMAERGSEISVVWGQMRQQKQRGVKSARLPRLPPESHHSVPAAALRAFFFHFSLSPPRPVRTPWARSRALGQRVTAASRHCRPSACRRVLRREASVRFAVSSAGPGLPSGRHCVFLSLKSSPWPTADSQ